MHFWSFFGIKLTCYGILSYKLLRICNLAKMALKISIIPYMGIRFLAITRSFLSNRAENFVGNSGDYLSIGDEKSWFWCFFWKIYYFGGNMGVDATVAPKGLGPHALMTRPKSCPTGSTFGSTVNSKICF